MTLVCLLCIYNTNIGKRSTKQIMSLFETDRQTDMSSKVVDVLLSDLCCSTASSISLSSLEASYREARATNSRVTQ